LSLNSTRVGRVVYLSEGSKDGLTDVIQQAAFSNQGIDIDGHQN